MKSLASALAFCALLLGPLLVGAAERELGDLGEVGAVTLPTSCDPAHQADFERGVALLHSFFYREARRVFSEIAEHDPDCAMAHWGVAMTHYHPLWASPDSVEFTEGRAAVERATAAAKQDDRERGFVRAIAAYYGGPQTNTADNPTCHGTPQAAARGCPDCFRQELELLAAKYPDDVEPAAFHALSLIATTPPGDPTLKNPRLAAQKLERWYAKQPKHPGLVHYLIHAYDYPPLAAQGLPAARAYASIAPWVPHALHMPSHIFTRLGMWKDSIESNEASAQAARRYASIFHPDAASFEELHALDYQMYGYLQTGQDVKARKLLDRLASIRKTVPEMDFAAAYAFGAMPARFALERRQWGEAATLELPAMPFWSRMPFAEGHIVYARAVGASRSGDLATARAAAERLSALAAASSEPRFRYFGEQMQTQHQAALGLIALAEGRNEEAIATLRAAAAREDSLGKHPVSPGAMFPVRELLGEALLDSGKPVDALAEFKASLRLNPGRFNGVYGAARSAMAAGVKHEAQQFYRELTALATASDGARPELQEAKKFLAGT